MTLRILARACVALFMVSTVFPVAAGVLNTDHPPRWLGIVDVAVAVLLLIVAAVLTVRTRKAVADPHRLAAFQIGQGVIGLIPVLLAAYFIAGARVNWTVLIIGLAWRGWLLIYSLPFLAAALAGPNSGLRPQEEPDRSPRLVKQSPLRRENDESR